MRETAGFLIEIMPVMSIRCRGAAEFMGRAEPALLVPIVVIIVVTTVFVMAVTGLVTQGIIRKGKP